MENVQFIMSMVAQTSIHAGAGQAVSMVDLPIQREGHTQHPIIFGSSLKGAIRARAKQALADDKDTLFAVFGADTSEQDNTHAGAVMVSDARLLLLPVRSLNGYFKWVTCPALLQRYVKDCLRAGIRLDLTIPLNSIDNQDVIVLHHKQDTLFLEEFALTVKPDASIASLIAILSQHFKIEAAVLTEQLAIVSDDMLTYLAQNSTPVNAHIALDDRKTVINGALWYGETLPPETVMYSLLMCTESRRKNKEMTAKDVANVVTERVIPSSNHYLQVGGNETVGMGWFEVFFNQAP